MSAGHANRASSDAATPGERRKHLEGQTHSDFARTFIAHRGSAVGTAIGVGVITFFIQGYRLSAAPDFYGDEAIHIQIADNLARGAGLVGVGRTVFLANPPAYFLVEAAYMKLAGLTNTDLFAALFSVRYLNVAFAAVTAITLMLFVRNLHSYKAGLVAAALFIMDPYVQGINRRNMLDTLAMLFALVGMCLFYTTQPHLSVPRRLGAGIAFGLATLTKEPAVLELIALVGYVTLARRSQVRDAAWVIATTVAVYLPYPMVALATGIGRDYLLVKLQQALRIPLAIGELFPGGPHPPNSSAYAHSVQNILSLVPEYGTSYLLIALGGIFTAILAVRFRNLAAARYLVTWSIVSFVGMSAIAMVSQWYFYYLIIPCTAVSGYSAGLLLQSAVNLRHRGTTSSKRALLPAPASHGPGSHWRLCAVVLSIFTAVTAYNTYLWTANYALGSDDAYVHAIEYVRTHVPAGEPIVVDNADFRGVFFLSYDTCCSSLDSQAIQTVVNQHVHYLVLSSKGQFYPGNSPLFYTWAVQNSRPVFQQEGRSFGTVGVYLRRDPGGG